jgi:trigger factor
VKVLVERQPASIVVLEIAADEDEFATSMDRAFRRVARDIQIPGFRKGKAPRTIVERFYGREVFLREAADEVMDALYRRALEQEDITPVGEPDVEIIELEPVAFKVIVPVYPTIEPGDYASVRVEPEDAAITEAEVEEVLERLRRSQAEWVEVTDGRTPREGDRVTVDYEVKEGDEDFQEPVEDAQFVLGETNLLQQLRDKIEEMHVGDTETFELAFDENDETADPSIRGKALAYTVTLKTIEERDLPELNDEFAKNAADAGSLEDLRAQIRDDVHQGKTSEARSSVVNRIIEQIAEGAEIDPPAVMVDEEVEHQLGHLKQNLAQSGTPYEAYLRAQGQTEEDVKAELRPEAERRLRNSLVLREVAKRENVEVSDEAIDARLDAMFGADEPAEDEDEEAAMRRQRVREMYRGDYFRNMLRNDLFDQMLTDHLIAMATEGKGAVLNGWEPAEPVEDESAGEDDAAGAVTAAVAADEAEREELEDTAGETVAETAETEAEIAASAAGDAGDDVASAGESGEVPASDEPGSAPSSTEGELTDKAPGAGARLAEYEASTGEATDSVLTDATAPDAEISKGVVAGDTDVEEAAEAFPALEGDSGEGWVKGNGENDVPEGYPVKGNGSSRIYHTPESRFYENTIAEYYFASPEVAESFGFRAPKGMKGAGADAGSTLKDLADEK